MLVEWLLIIYLLLGAGILMFRKARFARSRLAGFGFFATALLGVWLWQNHLEKKLASQAGLTIPRVGRPDEYAGSASCRACHPNQYNSWHQSFHRTMTQAASPESVRGKFLTRST